jgi:hypothetical protein
MGQDQHCKCLLAADVSQGIDDRQPCGHFRVTQQLPQPGDLPPGFLPHRSHNGDSWQLCLLLPAVQILDPILERPALEDGRQWLIDLPQ